MFRRDILFLSACPRTSEILSTGQTFNREGDHAEHNSETLQDLVFSQDMQRADYNFHQLENRSTMVTLDRLVTARTL